MTTYQRRPGDFIEACYDASDELIPGAVVFTNRPDYVVAPEGLLTVEKGARLEVRDIAEDGGRPCPFDISMQPLKVWRLEHAETGLKFRALECDCGFVFIEGW